MEIIALGEVLRQEIVSKHLEQGNRLAAVGDSSGAIKEFQTALALDPQNANVAQRLHDVTPPDENPEHKHVLELLAAWTRLICSPRQEKKLSPAGDTKQLFTQIGTAFGISMVFDQNLTARSLRFDLDNVDFYTVMEVARKNDEDFLGARFQP